MTRTLKSLCYASLNGAAVACSPYLLVSGFFAITGAFRAEGFADIVYSLVLLCIPLMIAFPAALAGNVIIGLPISLFLARYGVRTLWSYCVCGASGAALYTLILIHIFSLDDAMWLTIPAAAGGVAAAITWWMMIVRGASN